MSESPQKQASDPGEAKIPAHLALEIRRLSHDLSNALEVILQTNYLLGMTAAANADQKKWQEMLDQGVTQATQINRQLREFVRAHSE